MAEIAIPSTVVGLIDAHYEAERQSDDHYPTLRASEIRHECERRLWYRFRWAHPAERFSGRMLRLFETGEREESRMLDWLRDIGCTVLDRDPETDRQWRVTIVSGAIGGHLTGSCDARATGIPSAPVVEHVVECKTHNDKSFRELQAVGVAKAKPQHVSQMQVYMHGFGLSRALYLAKNKNDDAIHAERVAYDAGHALALLAKAERIITASAAPPKLHPDPAAKMAFVCKTCPAFGVCHGGEMPPMGRNCRTCLHSTACAGSEAAWFCARHKTELSQADQERGCAHHLYLPDLVPGEQIDASETAETVTYRKRDGSIWVDGGREAA